MVRARHRRPPSPIPERPKPRRRLATMSASNSRQKRKKKRPPPWRKPEDVELREEIRDLERDTQSGTQDGQTQVHDERDRAEPWNSWVRRRKPSTTEKRVPWMKPSRAVHIRKEIRDLEHDIALHSDTSTSTSTRNARALNRAAGRNARLESAQVRETRRPKKASQKK